MTRLDWDSYFLKLAAVTAERSSCCRRQVGTVLVRDNHLLSGGYNGPPRGAPPRTVETCVRTGMPSGSDSSKVCCSHSEANAVAIAAFNGAATKGSTAYVSLLPCAACARLLINAGVVRVVYRDRYDDASGLAVFEESGIVCEHKPW